MITRRTPTCPRCAAKGLTVTLDGGPVWWWCGHGHSIPAADVYHEFGEVTR